LPATKPRDEKCFASTALNESVALPFVIPSEAEGSAVLQARPGNVFIAVGTHITMRPPHRTVRAAFPHTAPTSGV
jgi:hypothetical protein